jgi:hypothetical protein
MDSIEDGHMAEKRTQKGIQWKYETSREKYGESGNLRESVSGSGTVSVSDK